jgi:hypothetical protein
VVRTNEQLILTIVADGTARGAHARTQGGFRDSATLPHRIDQFILADDPMTILNEMNKQVEHLRLGRNGFTPSPQLLLCDIDFASCKAKIHGISSFPSRFSVRLVVTSLCRASLWKSTNIIADGVSQENLEKK